jgi:Rad4 beta-hairpin domain 1/Rad4 transglutaminase-like domain
MSGSEILYEADSSGDEDNINWDDDDTELFGTHDAEQDQAFVRDKCTEDENEGALIIPLVAPSRNNSISGKRPRKVPYQWEEDDKKWFHARRKRDMTVAMAHAQALNAAANDESLQLYLTASLPDELSVESLAALLTTLPLEAVHQVLSWIRSVFTVLADARVSEDEGRDGNVDPALLVSNTLGKHGGSRIQACQLLLNVLRSLGLKSRLCVAFDPCSRKPADHIDALEAIKRKRPKTTPLPSDYIQSIASSSSLSSSSSPAAAAAAAASTAASTPGLLSGDETQLEIVSTDLPTTCNCLGGRLIVAAWIEISVSSSEAAGSATAVVSNSVSDVIDLSLSDDDEDPDENGNQASTADKADHPCDFKWVGVDVVRGITSEDLCVMATPLLPRSRLDHTMYVISVDEKGYIEDRSDAYLPAHEKLHRLPSNAKLARWWDRLLSGCAKAGAENGTDCKAPPSSSSKPRTAKSGGGLTRAGSTTSNRNAEAATVKVNVKSSKPMKKIADMSFKDFKDHPTFVLLRDLKANEILHPTKKKMVNIFRGEKVYLREHVEVLRSKKQWRQELREVRTAQKPLKIVSKHSREAGAKVEVKMYAEYQTYPYEVNYACRIMSCKIRFMQVAYVSVGYRCIGHYTLCNICSHAWSACWMAMVFYVIRFVYCTHRLLRWWTGRYL